MEIGNIYFIGIGGIGMSSIARYYKHIGKTVGGYDRTSTVLTRMLENEGMAVHYEDSVEMIPENFKNRNDTLVIYTPAIPADHKELNYFKVNGFRMVKRSQALGELVEGKYLMAVAGTHGKTTTSTMAAYLDSVAGAGASAFLGGIAKNFESNLVLGNEHNLIVEADEFDRSFLQLYPDSAVITAVDADHLDIYGTYEELKKSFTDFISQIKSGGILILNNKIELELPQREDIAVYRYSYDIPCDFYAKNIEQIEGGQSSFDIVCPDMVIENCVSGIPGWVNIENTVAAVALLWKSGFDKDKMREAIRNFKGVKRRFEFYINTPEIVYMDDYAHHPEELKAAISSLRKMFPGRKIKAIFQPHLFTRTRDFSGEFADALSLADEAILLPIYPAREQPLEGITSEIIYKNISCSRKMAEKARILDIVRDEPADVLVTFGAGDIDVYCKPICLTLKEKHGLE
ncbi:MAG: UDP-N-acetylmuramate--L-alanine ligase [Rikenellaceae bacterium]|nr:UDP-N-acetylmuramate--L-alanine ligase [Rikenellaceae bacterium]